MSASGAIDLPLDEIAAICREHEVAELSIFGSAVTGEFGPESDYDFLVVFKHPERTGLFAFFDVQFALEALLRREVDLVPKRGLKPLIRDEVIAGSRVVYGDIHAGSSRDLAVVSCAMPRSDRLYLETMLEACRDLRDMLAGATFGQIAQDEVLGSAVLYKFLVIRAAATATSEPTRERLSGIPWDRLTALDNVVDHGPYTVDWKGVWTIVTGLIPALERELEAYLNLSPEAW